MSVQFQQIGNLSAQTQPIVYESHYRIQTSPKSYILGFGPEKQFARDLCNKMELKGTEIVLDVGCAAGDISFYIASKLSSRGKVTGIDIDNEMIFAAQKRALNLESTISFEVQGIEYLPYLNQFDCVFFCTKLHQFNNLQQAFCGFERALKEKGVLYFSTYINSGDGLLEKAIAQACCKDRWMKRFTLEEMTFSHINEDDVVQALNSTRFTINHHKLIQCEYLFDDAHEFECWIHSIIGQYVKPKVQITNLDINDFVTDIVTIYLQLQDPARNNRKITYQVNMYEAFATKGK